MDGLGAGPMPHVQLHAPCVHAPSRQRTQRVANSLTVSFLDDRVLLELQRMAGREASWGKVQLEYLNVLISRVHPDSARKQLEIGCVLFARCD